MEVILRIKNMEIIIRNHFIIYCTEIRCEKMSIGWYRMLLVIGVEIEVMWYFLWTNTVVL